MDTLMEFSIQGDIFFFYDTLSDEEKETVRKCMREKYKGHIVANPKIDELNEARFSNIFIEKRASSCPQSLEKSRLFSYPLLMSEGENSQNVKRIFLRKVVI